MEIYTESDGTVIFKKYSPIGELGEFADQYAEALAKTAGVPACISDKDTVIAVSGISKKELLDKKISDELEQIMSKRNSFVSKGSEGAIPIVDGNTNHTAGVASPIIYDGDVIGTVMFLTTPDCTDFGDVECKLAQSAAAFLGKAIE